MPLDGTPGTPRVPNMSRRMWLIVIPLALAAGVWIALQLWTWWLHPPSAL